MIGRDTFSVLAPVLGPQQKKWICHPSSTVHGGQHDTKYVTFELLMHAAFVADEIGGVMLEQLVAGGCLYIYGGLDHPW